MKKTIIQRIAFIICAIAAFFNPMLEQVVFIRYILLAGSLLYLFFGWYFPLIKDKKAYLENEIAGYVYATVFFANYMDSALMPIARYLVIYGDILALAFIIYMIVKRKTVRRDMLIQSIILFLLSPIPMWV